MDPSKIAAGGAAGRLSAACTLVRRGLAAWPVGPMGPSCCTARLKYLGDDREIVPFVREQHSVVRKVPVQVGVCWRRKAVSCQPMDGWIRHSRLSVNIHDVIFS